MKSVVIYLLLAISCSVALSADLLQKPHIVILYADDMGYGDLGIQNPDSKILTPHLDRLAEQGMRFSDAHSSSGVCIPSRYALLQGRYHWPRAIEVVNSPLRPLLSSQRPTSFHSLSVLAFL